MNRWMKPQSSVPEKRLPFGLKIHFIPLCVSSASIQNKAFGLLVLHERTERYGFWMKIRSFGFGWVLTMIMSAISANIYLVKNRCEVKLLDGESDKQIIEFQRVLHRREIYLFRRNNS